MKKIFIAILILFVSGCATYKPAIDPESYIIFKLTKNPHKHANQHYYIYHDEQCTKGDNTGAAANLSTLFFSKEEKKVGVASNKKIFIKADASYSRSGQHVCTRVMSFTPVKGQTYVVQQSGYHKNCPVSVVNSHGVAPGDIKNEFLTKGCGRQGDRHMVYVTSHPEKGSYVVNPKSQDKSEPEKQHRADKRECDRIVFDEGVMINGSKTTNIEEIEAFEAEMAKLALEDIKDSLLRGIDPRLAENKVRSESDILNYQEYQRVNELSRACMKSIGWSTKKEFRELASDDDGALYERNFYRSYDQKIIIKTK